MSNEIDRAAYEARLQDKKETSSRIGETCRFISFGIVALVYTLQSSSTEFAEDIVTSYGFWISLSGVVGSLAITSDYLQYICGYFSASDALNNSEHNFKYDSKSLFYKGRQFFFWSKQVSAFVGATVISTITALEFLGI